MAFRRVNEFKEITLVYASNGAATLDFLTDIAAGAAPGALATALSGAITLPATGGMGKRQSITVPLDGVRGTEFQPKIVPGGTTQFELYSGVVYLRPIGVWINGAAPNGGEIWQPAPIAPGV
jgi:hypothetical protein